MGTDDQSTVLGEGLVHLEDVACGADLTAAEALLGHTEQEQEVLHQPDRRSFREDREHVETEGRRELESGKDADRSQQSAVFHEAIGLRGLQPLEVLKQFEVLDLAPHVGIAAHRVVVGERNEVELLLFGAPQDVEVRHGGLLVIRRRRRVDVKIHPSPMVPRAARRQGGLGDRFRRGRSLGHDDRLLHGSGGFRLFDNGLSALGRCLLRAWSLGPRGGRLGGFHLGSCLGLSPGCGLGRLNGGLVHLGLGLRG